MKLTVKNAKRLEAIWFKLNSFRTSRTTSIIEDDKMVEQMTRELAEFIKETAPKGSLTYDSCMNLRNMAKPQIEQIDIHYKAAFIKACERITNMNDEELQSFINDSKEIKGDKLVQYAILSLEEIK